MGGIIVEPTITFRTFLVQVCRIRAQIVQDLNCSIKLRESRVQEMLGLVRAARLGTYEDVGWARWLPGSNQLIVGAEAGSYAVDAATLTVRAFSFGPVNDINFSATVLPVP